MRLIRRFFNIKRGEGRPVFFLTLYYFFIMATSIAGRALSSGLFLNRVANAEAILPLMLIPVTISATLTISIYTQLAKRIALIPLLTFTGVFFALSLLALLPLLSQAWALIVLYIWMEVLNIILFFQFYIFAGTIFDTRQAKRLFGLLGLGGAVASVLAGLLLGPFMNLFGSEAVIPLVVSFVLLSVLMIWIARPYSQAAQPASDSSQPQAERGEGMGRYLWSIAIALGCIILAATIIHYEYQVIAKRSITYDERAMTAFYGLIAVPGLTYFNNNEIALTAFFGQVSAVVGTLMLLSRLFVVGPVLTRFGILAGLVLLPLAIATGSVGMVLMPVIAMAAALKIADQSIRFTLNETSLELLWVPVSQARKLAYKPFISGTIPSVMQGAAGIIIFVVVAAFPDNDVQALSVVVLLAVALWLLMVLRLRQGYLDELTASIQQRRIDFEDLDLTDRSTVDTINRSLTSSDEVEQALALSMLDTDNLTPWTATLKSLFQDGSYFVRQKVLDIAGANPDIIGDDELRRLIEAGPGDLTDEAIIAAGKRGLVETVPGMEPYLTLEDRPVIRAAAARAILMLNSGPVQQAQTVLREMLEGPDVRGNVIALNTLAELPTAVVKDLPLREMLKQRFARTRVLLLQMIENPNYLAHNHEIITAISDHLKRPTTSPAALRVLRNYDDAHVIEVLTFLLNERSTPPDLKVGIIRALPHYPQQPVVPLLLDLLDLNDLEPYDEAVTALLALARQGALDAGVIEQLHDATLQAARAIYGRQQLRALAGDDRLINILVETDIQRIIPALLRLSVMDVPQTQVEAIIYQIQSERNTGNALELLDNVLSRAERDSVIPLFEGRSLESLVRVGRRHFPDLPETLEPYLLVDVRSLDPWRSLIALDYVLRTQCQPVLDQIDWRQVPNTTAHKELVSAYADTIPDLPAARFRLREEPSGMYSTLEKTIILKGALLFKDIAPREIYHLAQIAAEEQFEDGAQILEEGAGGTCLYIVAAGQVRIHKGDQSLAVLTQGDAFGEMALFDDQPRSASATAVESVTLLRIDRDAFFDLLATRVEIMQGVARMLTGRLRTATQQVSALSNGR